MFATCSEWALAESGLGWWLPPMLLTVALHAACALLHMALPAVEKEGYVVDPTTNAPMKYRLNGLCSLVAVALLWAGVYRTQPLLATLLVERYRAVLAVSNFVGLALSAFFVQRAQAQGLVDLQVRCRTKDQPPAKPTAPAHAAPAGQSFAATFYLGLEFNPRLPPARSFDVKMFLYLVGACVLQWIVLSAVAREHALRGSVSLAMATFAALMTYFLAEYMVRRRAESTTAGHGD